jgi:hypothetical protein
MQEARSCANDVVDAVCDAFRQIGDVSFAIFPKDVAHALGDLQKAVLSTARRCVDWEIQWTEDRVAGGDRLRDEWREKCRHTAATDDEPQVGGV